MFPLLLIAAWLLPHDEPLRRGILVILLVVVGVSVGVNVGFTCKVLGGSFCAKMGSCY